MKTEEKNGSVGIAFDVGTTTIAGALAEIETGRILHSLSMENPQSAWGRDVISRINAAVGGTGQLEEMTRSVRSALGGLAARLIDGSPSQGPISCMAAAGNTVMEHLLLGVSPEPLSRVPYRPAFKEARTILSSELGLAVGGDPPLYVFPIIGGFVGGDTVAVMLSLGPRAANTLVIDIGTNSEIVLATGERTLATSAAAGPAFEGGELSCGMTAGDGAIQGVAFDGERLTLDVIGGVAPKGVCGSGLVDAVKCLLDAGVVEPNGRIRDPDELATNISTRIKPGDGGNRIVLHRGASGEVALLQSDLRALQVAKSAIRAGVEILLDKAGLTHADVEEVRIAGAFGSHLTPGGLAAIGLIPKEWAGKVEFIGDAALDGAALALSAEGRAGAERIAREVKYISLSGSALFEKEFIKNMDFTPPSGL